VPYLPFVTFIARLWSVNYEFSLPTFNAYYNTQIYSVAQKSPATRVNMLIELY